MTEMLQVNTERNISESLKRKFFEVEDNKNSDMYLHMQVLALIASRCNSILELGVRDIQSTWAFLSGLARESFGVVYLVNERKLEIVLEKKLVSVDIEDPSLHGKSIQEVKDIAQENGIDFEFIKGDTRTVDVGDQNFDGIFFDTDHTYEQLSAELEKFGHRANTWMIFHDISRFGKVLIPAVNEWLEKNPEWIIVPNLSTNECNGLLTIARVDISSWESYTNEKYSDRINKPL